MVKAFGKAFIKTMYTLESGSRIELMGLVHTLGLREIDMMESGKLVGSTEEVQISLQMETSMLENIRTGSLMARVYILGLQVHPMKGISKMDSSTDRGYGRRIKMSSNATSIKGHISWTRSMDTVNLLGTQEISIKEITTKMNEMDTEKCTLQMELYTKEIGSEGCKQVRQPW